MAADLAESGDLSSKMLKQLLDTCFAEGKDFAEVYERDKPQQISDAGAIEAMIDEVIAANPKQVAQYRRRQEDGRGILRRQRDAALERAGESRAAERTGHEEAGRAEQIPRLTSHTVQLRSDRLASKDAGGKPMATKKAAKKSPTC